MNIKEVRAKSILGKSGITGYCVNCYTGCTHACIYCYARFMKRFSGHEEPWGQFLDAKVNAPEILRKEVKKRKPGSVFISSVCDAYQPAEKRFRLTRACLEILVEAGFYPQILTKSKLVMRDFDILKSTKNCSLGCTLTTADEQLRYRIEPGASPTYERIAVLEEACRLEIPAYAFLGPFMPRISDTDEALSALIEKIATLPLSRIYADKLNPKPGVWEEILPFLRRTRPDLIDYYRAYFFDHTTRAAYKRELGIRIRSIARAYGIEEKLHAMM